MHSPIAQAKMSTMIDETIRSLESAALAGIGEGRCITLVIERSLLHLKTLLNHAGSNAQFQVSSDLGATYSVLINYISELQQINNTSEKATSIGLFRTGDVASQDSQDTGFPSFSFASGSQSDFGF